MSKITALLKIARTIKSLVFRKINPTWTQIEYFNPEWKNRIQIMSQYIGVDNSVVDIGCGQMWLKEFLTSSNKYIGVDYRQRDDETIVCDFNKKEYPQVKANVYFVSGCLEYIDDYETFIQNISANCNRCVISYCCTEDFSDLPMRRKRAWVNDLSREHIIDIFRRNEMELLVENITLTNNSIFVFVHSRLIL